MGKFLSLIFILFFKFLKINYIIFQNSPLQQTMNREAYTTTNITSPKQNSSWITQEVAQLDEYIQDEIPEMVFVFQADPDVILDVFQQSAQQLSFKLIEREQFHCTIIKNQPKQKFSICNCCKWFLDNTPITAIKIVITKNMHNSKKICKVRGLVGLANQIQAFLDLFEKKTKSTYKSSITVVQQSQQNHHQSHSNPFQIEAWTMYHVIKQLNNSNSQLGKKVAKQFTDFRQSFKNVKESADLLPGLVSNILNLINQINTEMCLGLPSKNKTKQFINYFRISIERYVFDNLQSTLLPIYNFKNKQTQILYEEKVDKIFAKYTSKQILQELSLNKKFWFIPQHMLNDKTTQNQLRSHMGYDQACVSLTKILITNSPRQKIKFVQQSYSRIKMTFYEKTKRQQELLIMQDIIPAIILLILVSNIRGLRTELDLMKDFLQCQNNNDLQSEKRIIINLSESYFYIVRDWTI